MVALSFSVSVGAGCTAPPMTPGSRATVADQVVAVLEPPPDPCAAAGAWHPLAALPLPGRVDHTAVWTGTEMVMWGGTQDPRHPMGDGARYAPETDSWQLTSTRLAPRERDDHAAVWTGREMIVWGGNAYSEAEEKLATGARYDPAENTWRATPPSGLSARDDPRAVWTGTEMIVWGGRDAAGHADTGARYAPARDRWRPVSHHRAPAAREDHTAVWTGTEMIVWGGWNGADDARDYALGGGRYDPSTDTWRPMSAIGAPEPREDHAAIWTGTEMIVWGGVVREGVPSVRHQRGTGGRYTPATDTWSPLTLGDAPGAREDAVVVWTGDEMIVWGGQRDEVPLESGARYLPALDTWCALPSTDAPTARRDHAGVWTGGSLLLWGGRDPAGAYLATGASYRPQPIAER